MDENPGYAPVPEPRPSPEAAPRDFELVASLLLIAGLELVLNRLAVPVLRPPGNQVVPAWHHQLDVVSLFVFHLATVMAAAVCVWETVRVARAGGEHPRSARLLLPVGVVLLLGLTGWAALGPEPPRGLSFHLESCFVLVLMLVGLVMTVGRVPRAETSFPAGDPLVKIGYLFLVLPHLVHYYATFALRLFGAPGGALFERLQTVGQWTIALSAIAVSVLFTPRPWLRGILRPGPAIIGGFVGAIALVLLIRHQEVGLELASLGLGIDLGPGTPLGLIMANVGAAAAVAWMLTTAFTSAVSGHRLLGMGFALVVVGGYAYAWPLQLVTVTAGALAALRAVIPPADA